MLNEKRYYYHNKKSVDCVCANDYGLFFGKVRNNLGRKLKKTIFKFSQKNKIQY